ncbi:hypothetical protein Tco_0090622 [Tanacetum coccineum]
MDSMHSTLSMYYDYDAHVKGELLVMMKNSQSVNLLIFISNTLIEFSMVLKDCDGIPKRPAMFLNLWRYKVVRHRYSNPMIQPEPEGSTQGYPLVSVEVLRFYTSAGNPVKEILLKLNLPDHRKLKDGGEAISQFLSSTNDIIDGDTPDTPPSPTHDYFSLDDSARDSSSDSSSEASLDFHSDASSDSSSRHSLLDHSSPDLPSTSARPSRKRRRDSGYLADVEVDPREISLRGEVIVRGSDEPHLEQDIDPEIQAEIDECIAYADALRDREIDARVVVEAVDREESKMGTRGLVEIRVERVTHPVMPEDTLEPAQEERVVEWSSEGAGSLQVIKGVQREQGRRIVRVESAVTALTERIATLEKDNRRLRGTMPNTRSGASMTHEEIEDFIARRVAEEIEAREAAINLEPLNENGDEQEGGNRVNRGNENKGNGGNGNGGNGGNGNEGNG